MKFSLKSWFLYGWVVALGVSWMASVGAATLSGQIAMMGKATLDAPLATATSVLTFGNARVGMGMGDYDVPGAIPLNTPVTFTPLLFTTTPSSPFVLWQFEAGGSAYAFEVHELIYDRYAIGTNSFLNLSGWGYATVDGLRGTLADFCFSTQQCTDSTGTTVTWSAETIVPSVPEGGKTVVSLFLGLLGIEIFRRRLHNQSGLRFPAR